MQPVLSSHGQRCPGVISFSLSRVLLEEIGHCTLLLNHCRGELTSWDASVCWLLERVHRCICLSASLPWFLLLSFLATIGAAYPGIRFFRTRCRIVWIYQHLLSYSILYLSLFSLLYGSASKSCYLRGALWVGWGGVVFHQNREDYLPSPSMSLVWRWTFLGCPTHGPCPWCVFLWDSWNVQLYPVFPDGSTWLREDSAYLNTVRWVF